MTARIALSKDAWAAVMSLADIGDAVMAEIRDGVISMRIVDP